MATKITDLGNKQVVKQLGHELEKFVQQFAAERGLAISYAGGAFDTDSFLCRLRFKLTGDALDNAARAKFLQDCAIIGLEPTDFGRCFKHGRRTFRIVGVNYTMKPLDVVEVGNGGKPYRYSEITRDRLFDLGGE